MRNIERKLLKQGDKYILTTEVEFNLKQIKEQKEQIEKSIETLENSIKFVEEELKPVKDGNLLKIRTYSDLRKANVVLERILLQQNKNWKANKEANLKGMKDNLLQVKKDLELIKGVLNA